MTGPEQRYLRPSDIAEQLGVHLRTVRRWIANGTLPSVLIGGARRIAEADLLLVLESGRQHSGAALPTKEAQP